MGVPASALVLDSVFAALSRPHGARLGLAIAIAVLMLTWLVGSWRSIRFTMRHLGKDDSWWEARNRRSRQITLRVGLGVGILSCLLELVALHHSDFFLATATLGPLATAAFVLAGLADLRRQHRVSRPPSSPGLS